MKIIIKLLFLLIGFQSIALANEGDEPLFLVYGLKGRASMLKNGTKTLLKIGDKILTENDIEVAKGATLSLICKQYSKIDLISGKYTGASLSAKCEKEKSSFSANYFHYIWEQMSHHHEYADKNPKKFMKNTGAVSRGTEEVRFELKLDSLIVDEKVFQISFQSHSNPVMLTLSHLNSESVVKRFKVSKKVVLDSIVNQVGAGEYNWFFCNPTTGKCDPKKYLHVLTKDAYSAKVNQVIMQLKSQITTESEGQIAFMKAFTLEENNLLNEAKKYYQLAQKYEPNNPSYKIALARYD
ncbi:hypothetical protein [Pedobacter sp. MW01-1-1]|uniref:hypothetical protein n=1 Tax=Pedobacter sp. MW01-1-1 TaxID=3383027 RepID=UPI003FED5D76